MLAFLCPCKSFWILFHNVLKLQRANWTSLGLDFDLIWHTLGGKGWLHATTVPTSLQFTFNQPMDCWVFPPLQEGAHTIPGPVWMLNTASSNTLRQFHPWPRIIPHNPVLVISTLVGTVLDSKGWAPFPSACPPPSWCSSPVTSSLVLVLPKFSLFFSLRESANLMKRWCLMFITMDF